MNTTSNIAAIQSSGVANTPQSQSHGQTPQGLLGFLEAFIQQLQATAQGGGTPSAAQSSPQDLKALTAEIAAQLKKDGVTADALKNMSPQDLAAKITALLQQQNITIPPALLNLTPQDLATNIASLIQKNGAQPDNSPSIKPTLTSDLIAPQSSNVQDIQTKDQIAKKISSILEQQQGAGTTPNPALLHQLKEQITQLQSAPGTVSQDTLNQLTTDFSSLLTSQGVDQSSITKFLVDLSQSLQKNKTATADASAAPATTTPAPATTDTSAPTPATNPASTIVAAAIQPVVQPPQTNTPQTAPPPSATLSSATLPATSLPSTPVQSDTSAVTPVQSDTSAVTPQIINPYLNLPASGNLPKASAAPILGGKDTANILPQASASAAVPAQQQQASTPQQNLTAKIAGISVNPALINDLANNSNSGFGGGFGSQGNNTQQQQDLTGTAAFLQPVSTDTLNNMNFTNYLSSAPGQPSSTTQMINIQLQRNINAGINSMTLQLEPAELGKMDVKLSFAKDGTVKAHMTVDKPETLALLQKDSPHLQRALQQSGIDTDENSLSFDLRQQTPQQNMNGFSGGNRHADEISALTGGTAADNALQAQIAIQSSGYITSSGVNIMV